MNFRLFLFVAALVTVRVAFAPAASAEESQPFLLQMIRDDSVHQELRLSDEQIAQVDQAIAEVDPRWWVCRIQKPEVSQAEIQELTQILRTRLDGFLDADQRLRLTQLVRQAHGTRMIRDSEVAATLKVTEKQKSRFETLFSETDAEVASAQKKLSDKEITSEKAGRQISEAQQSERQGIISILTSKQQAGIGPLVGKSFDFSGVKRTYPRAPEFVAEGSKWIGATSTSGEPIRMEDLRGKVVAVYFYAFQCINCQRNFPHYTGWHADMADDGLVVIGIQTPETSAERSLDRVSEAIQKDGFEYPVLFDEQSHNWRAWGNTMWPTTYLIDKKGFIRRWWQGEMNWKGTPGEQQMRESIETLLAEND